MTLVYLIQMAEHSQAFCYASAYSIIPAGFVTDWPKGIPFYRQWRDPTAFLLFPPHTNIMTVVGILSPKTSDRGQFGKGVLFDHWRLLVRYVTNVSKLQVGELARLFSSTVFSLLLFLVPFQECYNFQCNAMPSR